MTSTTLSTLATEELIQPAAIESSLLRLGFNPDNVRSAVRELYKRSETVAQGNEVKETYSQVEQVRRLLKELGIPAHLKGYRYLQDSIVLVISDENLVHQVTTLLYPTVAKNNGTTSSRVERAIRHAIEVAWDNCPVDILHFYFSNSVSPRRDNPTNAAFIAQLAEYLR